MRVPLCLAILASLTVAEADPLEDARSVIAEVEAGAASGEATPIEVFQAELREFRSKSKTMPPREAASGWLALHAQWEKSINEGKFADFDSSDSGFIALVAALPPPTAWDELRWQISESKTIDELTKPLLELLAATLCNDPEAQWKTLEVYRGFSDQPPKGSAIYSAVAKYGQNQQKDMLNGVAFIIATMLGRAPDSAFGLERSINAQIDILANMKEERSGQVSVPDIVQILGRDTAAKLLTNALKKGVPMDVSGDTTNALLRDLVLADRDNIKKPNWRLVDGVGEKQVALFELFSGLGVDSERDRYARQSATASYIESLAAFGRFDEAGKALGTLDDKEMLRFDLSDVEKLEYPNAEVNFFEFQKRILASDPQLPYWSDMVKLALDLGKKDEAVALAEKVAVMPDIFLEQREQVLAQLGRVFLAASEIDRGVGILSERIKVAQKAEEPKAADVIGVALNLSEIGKLTNRPELVARAVEIVDETVPKLSGDELGDTSLIKYLAENGTVAEAQKYVVAQMVQESAADANSGSPTKLDRSLSNLLGLYDVAGKPSEVLALLESAPWWGKIDLSQIAGDGDFRGIPLGIIAAKAFDATGDKSKAVACLKATIEAQPLCDLAYGMLVEMEGDALLPYLDSRFARDRFEERPLIWKALLLYRAGKLEDAEKIARKAIAIDPSDGEMGKGDRMRVYAVLADILEKKGDAETAKIYRNAVAAIRMAEDADDYRSAGLEEMAVEKYKASLTLFADAYCIQSRLAVQLADMGRMQEAEEHYRRAYELMPDSFGRMESHCFGCERAFKGPFAESLAERTFKKLIEQSPDKPQLHYLLGYLRQEQGRDREALVHFTKAVELDPDYINAWKKIQQISRELCLPVKVRDDATFALLRLDAERGDFSGNFGEIGDLKKLWTMLDQFEAARPKEKAPDIFPLSASQKYPAKDERKRPTSSNDDSEKFVTPEKALQQQQVIYMTGNLLSGMSRYRN